MIVIADGGFAPTAHLSMHATAPIAALLQGMGVPTSAAIAADAFGTPWRLRGKRATAEYDSAPPPPV